MSLVNSVTIYRLNAFLGIGSAVPEIYILQSYKQLFLDIQFIMYEIYG